MTEPFAAVKWESGKLILLDQRKLPAENIYLEYDLASEVAKAIKDMVVRGAPAIGIAAAYAVVLAARSAYQSSADNWREIINTELELLSNSRPTAVNLNWAIAKMRQGFDSIEGDPETALLEMAIRIHDEDIAANHEMGRLGAELIKPDSQIITHCNAGALATGGYGTALGVIRTAFKNGLVKQVYSSETRPWMQGARLTSWELQQDNIPVNLVIDSAVSSLMQSSDIDWLIVGSDRIAANGDVANKIGTYSHAVSAKYHGVKVMVVAPFSTVDMQIKSGKDIPIEYRNTEEITDFNEVRVAPNDMQAINPAFDITPAKLVDVIVTEEGIVQDPDAEKMLAIFGKI
ncbi:MAG: S-methyl-5-thioribose-1-phosphate isomerase [Proteobacteria bacterium]|nr:S-methyl-5-thioribose-1-phosphate isomerase [Pseudomonadota bacterium]NOG61304.1 S-methyl-5-thioribose-1-phosphate isomerase [Pseudomonadota bacterium]